MWYVFWANILLIIALILLQDVNLFYSPNVENSIIIEYLIFVFTPAKNKKKKRKIKHKRILFSLALDLIKYASVTVKGDDEVRFSRSALSTFLTLPFLFSKITLITFLRANARQTIIEENLDYDALIKIQIPVYYLFILLLKYPYYIIKDKFKRVKNER